jgi:predicted acylesterase/phospholipase RssA
MNVNDELPPPLTEQPPADRYADLVMTGGVASGVVYPWAVLELARHFRFRNIGGTSVGAMAAVLAAAAEYGRRHGHAQAFEALRLLPRALAERPPHTRGQTRRTRMLSLFQPAPAGRRLFELVVAGIDAVYGNAVREGPLPAPWRRALGFAAEAVRAYGLKPALWMLPVAALAVLVFVVMGWACPCSTTRVLVGLAGGLAAAGLTLLGGLGLILVWLLGRVALDLRRGVVDNDLGLCRGSSTETDERGQPLPALVDWLHEAVQASAGLRPDDAPLTFERLWHAPLTPGGPGPERGIDGEVSLQDRSIHLEMISSHVSHGRPRRLPLRDRDARLFFDPAEWRPFFPKVVMDALEVASEPYRPRSPADPPADTSTAALRELPGGRMPIVVAARLSLSFPILFSAPPVWSIDYEGPDAAKRLLRRGRMSDGGLCANFPIEFFDVGWPPWPTFGIWLESQSPYWPGQRIWRPKFLGQGRGDRFQHFEGEPELTSERRRARVPPASLGALFGFLGACLGTAKDWRDRSQLRRPDTRTRVVRVQLAPKESALNIAMPAAQIMDMARKQGTQAGLDLVAAYVPQPGPGAQPDAWSEHLWARLCGLVAGLEYLLEGAGAALNASAHGPRFDELLQRWQLDPPVRTLDGGGTPISQEQAERLRALMDLLQQLHVDLRALPSLPQRPRPRSSDFSLRPPL